MRKSILALSTALILVLPPVVSAQGFGVAGRVGTLGVGGEVALGLTSAFVIRGGAGVSPFDPSVTINDVDVTLKLPQWYNVGADLYLGGSFRVGGGMLFKSEDPSIEGVFTANQDIGGRSFTPAELGTLTGVLASNSQAPYVLIGFGNHTSTGIGLFLDLGVAFLGDPEISLASSGGAFGDQAELISRLNAEAADWEDQAGSYLNYWPILNIGLRIGVGGS
ncbi:MAG TPA: hypothetical protein EYQ27_19630 [Gemmatimonadetes bacterium]|nr:hypothetical protein [Gemmatimonadota bacterium]